MTDPDEFHRSALGWLVIGLLAVYAALSPAERRWRRAQRERETG